MIDYTPFWNTIQKKNITTYYLLTHCKLSGSLLDKLRWNKGISTATIDRLCSILDCQVQDILRYVPDA